MIMTRQLSDIAGLFFFGGRGNYPLLHHSATSFMWCKLSCSLRIAAVVVDPEQDVCMLSHTQDVVRQCKGKRLMLYICLLGAQEKPMEVSDEQALPVLIEALCGSVTGPLAALKLPDQAVTFRQRVTWLRKFSTEHLQEPMQAQAATQTVHDSSDHQNTYSASDSGTAAVGSYAEQDSGPNLEQKVQAAAALPDLSDASLAADVVSWLQPHLRGVRSLAQAQSLDWEGIFR